MEGAGMEVAGIMAITKVAALASSMMVLERSAMSFCPKKGAVGAAFPPA